MNLNKILIAIAVAFSAGSNADYMYRAPLKSDYNFFPDTEYIYGEWEDIGDPGDCSNWSPEPSVVEFGLNFEQEMTCVQDQSRTVQVIHKNPDTGDTIVGEKYLDYGEIDVLSYQDSLGAKVSFSVSLSGLLEYQNDSTITASADLLSATSINWSSSSNIKISGSSNSISLSAKDEDNGWIKYQLIDSEGGKSDWSPTEAISVVNDYVDLRYLSGTTYQGNSKSIGNGKDHSNYTYETWVMPHKSIKTDSVKSNLGIDGVHGENYAFYPTHGHDTSSHGMGLSVGTNGVKIHIHSSSYMPAIYVNYHSIPSNSWTHFAVSVSNNVATIYKNGSNIGQAYAPSTGTAFAPLSVGDASSYGAFYGKLAESRVWDKPLSGSDIKNLYTRHLSSHTASNGAKIVKVIK